MNLSPRFHSLDCTCDSDPLGCCVVHPAKEPDPLEINWDDIPFAPESGEL